MTPFAAINVAVYKKKNFPKFFLFVIFLLPALPLKALHYGKIPSEPQATEVLVLLAFYDRPQSRPLSCNIRKVASWLCWVSYVSFFKSPINFLKWKQNKRSLPFSLGDSRFESNPL